MHGARVVYEVQARPGIASKEISREHVALQAVTAAARGNEVAWRVNAAASQREDVVDRRDVEVERSGAVDTPAAAVTHHGVLDRTLLVAAVHALRVLGTAGGTWESRE